MAFLGDVNKKPIIYSQKQQRWRLIEMFTVISHRKYIIHGGFSITMLVSPPIKASLRDDGGQRIPRPAIFRGWGGGIDGVPLDSHDCCCWGKHLLFFGSWETKQVCLASCF